MKKPTLRSFANKVDDVSNTLDVLCWMLAERTERDLGIPPEQGADQIKRLVLSGQPHD